MSAVRWASPGFTVETTPTTVTKSRWPLTLSFRTTNPFSSFRKVTRSIRPAIDSTLADGCTGAFWWWIGKSQPRIRRGRGSRVPVKDGEGVERAMNQRYRGGGRLPKSAVIESSDATISIGELPIREQRGVGGAAVTGSFSRTQDRIGSKVFLLLFLLCEKTIARNSKTCLFTGVFEDWSG